VILNSRKLFFGSVIRVAHVHVLRIVEDDAVGHQRRPLHAIRGTGHAHLPLVVRQWRREAETLCVRRFVWQAQVDFERLAAGPKRDDVRVKSLARPFLTVFKLRFDQERCVGLPLVYDAEVRKAGACGGIDIAIQREGDDFLVLGRAAVDGFPKAETRRCLVLPLCRRD
jgi:hypothetical protein